VILKGFNSDEADVFLEARDSTDIMRNALVSGSMPVPRSLRGVTYVDLVLLRVMEYYDGILILTTNRIKTFDVAVQSRVHLAIKYTDLSAADRKKIFFKFFEQLNSENTENLAELVEYVKEEFDESNGRQIRNVVTSAMALTRGRGEKLKLRDIN